MLLTVQVYRKRLTVIFMSLRVEMIRNKCCLLTNTITEFKKIYDLKISSFTFAWFTLLRSNCKNAWCTLEVMHLLILQFVCQFIELERPQFCDVLEHEGSSISLHLLLPNSHYRNVSRTPPPLTFPLAHHTPSPLRYQ